MNTKLDETSAGLLTSSSASWLSEQLVRDRNKDLAALPPHPISTLSGTNPHAFKHTNPQTQIEQEKNTQTTAQVLNTITSIQRNYRNTNIKGSCRNTNVNERAAQPSHPIFTPGSVWQKYTTDIQKEEKGKNETAYPHPISTTQAVWGPSSLTSSSIPGCLWHMHKYIR